MKISKKHSSLWASIAILLLAACSKWVPTPIQEIVANPRNYESKTIMISGVVTDRNSLVLTKYFTLKDKTGEIQVFTDRALPEIGSTLKVQGHVKQPFVFGKTDFVVFEEESIDSQK